MRKKATITILVVLLLSLCLGCNLFKDPDIINKYEVKKEICDLIWYDCSPSDLKVLDWVYNEDQLGDNYTGYIVTYEVGNGKQYILADVIEFDNTSRWEVEVVHYGRYLSEIRQYIE